MNKLGSAATKVGKIGAKGFGLMIKGISSLTAATASGVTALGAIGIQYNTEMESFTSDFKIMLGSTEEAVKKVDSLKKMAAKTPFEMGDLSKATKTLLSFNVAKKDTNGVLQKLGDISLGNAEKLGSLSRAYGKMNAAQKVTLEDINMMIDAGYNPLLNIQQKTGESMNELYGRISKGKVSFEEIQGAIEAATSAGGQYYNGMVQASTTTQGLISTLKDNARALVGEVFMPISESLVKKVLPGAINAIEKLTEAYRTNGIDGMIYASTEIITNALTTFTKNLPKFVDMAFKIINKLVSGIEESLPQITDAAFTTFETYAKGIVELIPRLVKVALKLVKKLAEYMTDNMSEIVQASIELFTAIIDTFVEFIPELIPVAVKLVFEFGKALIKEAPKLQFSVIKLGKAIIEGIIEGVKTAWVNLKATIKSLSSKISQTIKSSLGIHSPSKVMRDEVGRWIPLGIAEGIEKTANVAIKSMKKLSDSIVASSKSKQIVSMVSKASTSVSSTIKKRGKIIKKDVETYNSDILKSCESAWRRYKTGHETSLNDEIIYWENVKKQLRNGTKARLEAEEKYKKALESRNKSTDSYNKQALKLQEDYQKQSKEITQKLIEDTDSLWKQYYDAIESRASSLYSGLGGLFDSYKSETDQTAESLLDNMNSQVSGLAEWASAIEKLGKRGVASALLDELRQMGPSATANLQILNSMTDEQLTQYMQLWKTKTDLTKMLATDEMEQLKNETINKTKELNIQAEIELKNLTNTYVKNMSDLRSKAIKEIGKMPSQFKNIGVAAGKKLVEGLRSQVSAVKAAAKELSDAALVEVNVSKGSRIPKTPSSKKVKHGNISSSAKKNNGNGNVTVYQNIYSEAKSAADLMNEAYASQKRGVLMGV